jgi:hypothetical protein
MDRPELPSLKLSGYQWLPTFAQVATVREVNQLLQDQIRYILSVLACQIEDEVCNGPCI